MVKVFSFCIYGNRDKYCKGILKNVELINRAFPDFEIWIYIGNDVKKNIIDALENNISVKCIYTGVDNHENMMFRFFPIDDPNVEIAFVRDADSRVNERDITFINEFIKSDKLFHIVKDHPFHKCVIMGGIWGIKQNCLKRILIKNIYLLWKTRNDCSLFYNDTMFLRDMLYPLIKDSVLLHDKYIENDKHFVGQVYDFDNDGNEITEF